MNCAIVIPIYKQFNAFTERERKSIKQCFNILKNFDIYFVNDVSLDFAPYEQLAQSQGVRITSKRFERQFFESVNGYNDLMTSEYFYSSFASYDYLLLYQPDSYVFNDELIDWCNKGYDYIGSPWFEGWTKPSEPKRFTGVGNGGFSLRNVKTHIRILKRIRLLQSLRKFWFKSKLQAIIRFQIVLKLSIWKFSNKDNINNIFFPTYENEDLYWCQYIGKLFSDYKIAPIEDAIRFSFEVNPSYLYQLNSQQLPFGCHAWEKYELDFWKEHISTKDA